MLVTLTAAPLCVSLPFQSWVIVCPLAKVQVRVQFERAVVPVLSMVTEAPKPPGHWFVIV